jgi:hypothetical protein
VLTAANADNPAAMVTAQPLKRNLILSQAADDRLDELQMLELRFHGATRAPSSGSESLLLLILCDSNLWIAVSQSLLAHFSS